MPACEESASILCARLIRGTRSRLKALTLRFASAPIASALVAGWRKLISTLLSRSRATSSGVGGWTWSTAPAADQFRSFAGAVVGADAVEQGQLHVRDPAPEASVKLSNLVFTTPAPPEGDDLVLAVLVQGSDQPLELAAVFGARVLDPESIVGLREGTLGPGFKGAALQSGLRHIR